ncbi:DUF2188 domain-containing protein [Salinisphaera sp. T31B1]|uniref:DUF2188 domain-containing protein n=1 Tax=Salinisphaera sp. T31B1 TaxID=727963 RepID=UPI00333F3488
MAEIVYWVWPRPAGWMVQREGSERAAAIRDTRDEALAVASELARSAQSGRVYVQEADGDLYEHQAPDE